MLFPLSSFKDFKVSATSLKAAAYISLALEGSANSGSLFLGL